MIHQSSIVDAKAKISKNVKVGPFCYVGPEVQLGENVELISNVKKDISKSNKLKAVGLCDTTNLCGALEFAENISKLVKETPSIEIYHSKALQRH